MTLPLIHTMSAASESDRAWLIDMFRQGEGDGPVLSSIQDMVRRYGGIEYSFKKVQEYGGACRKTAETLEESECRDALVLLSDYVVQRACCA